MSYRRMTKKFCENDTCTNNYPLDPKEWVTIHDFWGFNEYDYNVIYFCSKKCRQNY